MKIKPHSKPKKKVKLSTLRNKCDKALQEAGRLVYDECIVCGKPHQLLHHYFPKSTSSHLRYDWMNLINLCQSCHFKHHNGDPTIHNAVNKAKGEEWLDELTRKKRLNIVVKPSQMYYNNILESIELIKSQDNVDKLLKPYRVK